VDRFDTGNPDDVAAWTAIAQKVADQVATVSFEDKQYDSATRQWTVLIRWMEHYYTNPDKEVVNADK
jgi:hypothetical protein